MHAVIRYGPLLGLALLLVAPLGWTRAATAVVRSVGSAAPDVSLPSLHAGAEPVRLADFRGKVVYLDFWSAWCAPCRRAMPRLDDLRRAFPREAFEVVGVNVDAEAADARRFLEGVPVSYPVAADSAGRVAAEFGVSALPALIVIGADGVVRDAIVGDDVEAHGALRATLVDLIAEREVR
ncbi:MAG: TlpA disulfide reductase family protein [Pseudomonadales bacterium]